jgi:hypothetical protein
MNSNQILSGEDLKNLYTEHKLTNELQTQENLKKLLNYELDNIGDTFDSNFDFEIIDFCVEKLKEQDPVDEQKLDFLGKKIAYESQEIARQKKQRRTRKRAIQVASILLILGVVLVTNRESIAGNFDFVRQLIWEDHGEQLVIKSPDSALSGIEKEEGHLPDSLPDEFSFIEVLQDNTAFVSTYNYIFEDTDGNQLSIFIKDYGEHQPNYNNGIEIDQDSTTSKKIDDTTYYYSSNIDINSISWAYKNCIYKICGDYSFDELDQIRSLYAEEQKIQ